MAEDLIGKTLGPFIIEKRLGQGAMGLVYAATHKGNGKQVAIKVITRSTDKNAAKLAARFEKEIEFLGMFRHPNIVRFYGASEDKGVRYYAMELVEGVPLDDVLRREPVLPIPRAISYASQICEALQEMHSTGILHRDLKPSNVLVTKDDKIKLVDFGIARDMGAWGERARLTEAGHTVGTLKYMSPEQLGGHELSRRSDLYTLGILIYEMLTGHHPFPQDQMMEFMKQRQSNTFVPPTMHNSDLPLEVDALVAQLLALNPEDRPRDAYMVMQRLMDLEKRTREGTMNRSKPRASGPAMDTVEMRRSAFSTLLATVFGNRDKKTKSTKEKRKEETVAATNPLESPIVLVLALFVVVGFLAYIFWPASTDELMAEARQVMNKQGVTLDEMIRVDNDVSKVILTGDPESPFTHEIAQWREKIAMEKARGKANLAIRTNRIDPDASEAERKYIGALRLREVYEDTESARQRFSALINLFADDVEARPWVALARQQLEQEEIDAKSDQERLDAKRQRVAKLLDSADKKRQGDDSAEGLRLFADIESSYRDDASVADLIDQARFKFLPPDEIFRRAEKLTTSDDDKDWERAFKNFLDPLIAQGAPEPMVRRIEALRAKWGIKRAHDKTKIDLQAGLPADATEPERMYVVARYVTDVLGDDLAARDECARLVGRFGDDATAAPWVALANEELVDERKFASREERRLERKRLAREALDKLEKKVAENEENNRWVEPVRQLYSSNGETADVVEPANTTP